MSNDIQKFQIPHIEKTIRLSELDITLIPQVVSKSQWKKLIKKNQVQVNGNIARTATLINPNDWVEIEWKNSKLAKIFPLEISVIYEDEYLAVVHKPAGFPVSGNYYKTIENALPYNLKRSRIMAFQDSFQPCHRLDKLTAGLLIISKTKKARDYFSKSFEDKVIEKKYLAVVQGDFNKQEGFWERSIENKTSKSGFKVLKSTESRKWGPLHLLELTPFTGRTHQLRIHCAENETPIAGDKLYNTKKTPQDKGLFLFANNIAFQHPIWNEKISLSIPKPKKFDWIFR